MSVWSKILSSTVTEFQFINTEKKLPRYTGRHRRYVYLMCIIFGKRMYIIYNIHNQTWYLNSRPWYYYKGITSYNRYTSSPVVHSFYKLEKYSLWQRSISIIVAIINYIHIQVGGQFEEQCVTYNDIFWFDVYLIHAGVLRRKDDNPMYLPI